MFIRGGRIIEQVRYMYVHVQCMCNLKFAKHTYHSLANVVHVHVSPPKGSYCVP